MKYKPNGRHMYRLTGKKYEPIENYHYFVYPDMRSDFPRIKWQEVANLVVKWADKGMSDEKIKEKLWRKSMIVGAINVQFVHNIEYTCESGRCFVWFGYYDGCDHCRGYKLS